MIQFKQNGKEVESTAATVLEMSYCRKVGAYYN